MLSRKWDYKPNIDYISQSKIKITTIDKTHFKCDCMDVSILIGIRQPVFYSFALDKPPGFKIMSEPETIQYKKWNISVFFNVKFHLEDDDGRVVDCWFQLWNFDLYFIVDENLKY